MPSELATAFAGVAERLLCLASKDAELRSQIRKMARVLLDATESSEPHDPESSIETALGAERTDAMPSTESARASVAALAPPSAGAPAQRETRSRALPELTLGRSTAVPPQPDTMPVPVRWATAPEADLSLIEARCRLKAEGARWAAERRRLMAEGASFLTEIDPRDREIIARAKALPDCFLWMCHPSGPSPADLNLYENVAGCFDAVADVLCVLTQIQDARDPYQSTFERSLDLLAEAQSSLRIAIVTLDGPSDSDQAQVFAWLKQTARESQVFIRRYMRSDDPADPARWTDLASRIEEIDAVVQELRRQTKQRRKLLGKVRHKLSLIKEAPDGAAEHWRILVATVEELVDDGLPPSNRALRELLIPVVDRLPDLGDLPKGFQLVLREIDRFLAATPAMPTTALVEPTPQVREVARILNGRSMVLIGGERRPASYQAIKDAFGLRALYWIDTREHQSIDRFEPYVARSDVAVVLLAIRWSSHSFGEISGACDVHGKPLVRLPGGYSPNQVAAQIMSQCSERLKASAGGA